MSDNTAELSPVPGHEKEGPSPELKKQLAEILGEAPPEQAAKKLSLIGRLTDLVTYNPELIMKGTETAATIAVLSAGALGFDIQGAHFLLQVPTIARAMTGVTMGMEASQLRMGTKLGAEAASVFGAPLAGDIANGIETLPAEMREKLGSVKEYSMAVASRAKDIYSNTKNMMKAELTSYTSNKGNIDQALGAFGYDAPLLAHA